jgi:hypothetical protein
MLNAEHSSVHTVPRLQDAEPRDYGFPVCHVAYPAGIRGCFPDTRVTDTSTVTQCQGQERTKLYFQSFLCLPILVRNWAEGQLYT